MPGWGPPEAPAGSRNQSQGGGTRDWTGPGLAGPMASWHLVTGSCNSEFESLRTSLVHLIWMPLENALHLTRIYKQ